MFVNDKIRALPLTYSTEPLQTIGAKNVVSIQQCKPPPPRHRERPVSSRGNSAVGLKSDQPEAAVLLAKATRNSGAVVSRCVVDDETLEVFDCLTSDAGQCVS
jgi:hypothetical protein